jgi:GNAT superfamily N-acetyltransferase
VSRAAIDYRPIDLTDTGLERACAFMQLVFPHARHYSVAFLDWMYRRNPDGRALGLEGFDGDRLVAHLAALPQQTVLHGRPARVMLWVNGATHPEYRGQGLYLRLCNETNTHLAAQGVEAIIGVANQNTIRAYETKLHIQNVAGLEARLGIGDFLDIDWPRAESGAQLRRLWTPHSLAWRAANPSNPLSLAARPGGAVVRGPTHHAGIDVFAPLPSGPTPSLPGVRARRPIQLALGLTPRGAARHGLSWPLPDRLKPSPLRLIYRNLANAKDRLDAGAILFSFLDFDAY